MKLKKYKLRKLCLPNQIGKYGIPAPAIAYSNGKIRYLRISDISEEGTLVNTDKKSVESDDIEQYILEENDIVFARTGNSTGRAYLYDKRDGVMAYAGFLIKYQLDEHKVNPIYLRYFTLSTFYKQWVANLSVGSTRGNISAQTFADCPIVLPPRHQQDVLVETLSNIDAKIKLNRQINDNLEAMAKQLYDYWFVQFDFPNEEGKPYKSSGGAMVWNEKLKREIPQGWTAAKIKDVAQTYSGGTPTSTNSEFYDGGDIPWINSGELNNPIITSTTNYITEEGLNNSSAKLYPQDTVLVALYGATAGKVSLLSLEACSNQAVCGVIPQNKIMTTYIRYYLSSLYEHFITLSSGSARDNISQDTIKNTILPIPQGKILKEFSDAVAPIISKIIANQKEMENLTKQRDELLPLLMNGQAFVNYHLSDD